MLKKVNLSSMLIVCCASTVFANAAGPEITKESPVNTNAFEYYVGLGAGVSYLNGTRNETASFGGERFPVQGRTTLKSTTGSFTLLAGMQYNIPQSRFYVGLEPSFTYAKHTAKTAARIGQVTDLEKISSRYAIGMDLKPGLKLTDNDSIYISVGTEFRPFKYRHENSRGMRASDRQNLWAFAYGIGYDHNFGRVSLGVNLKHRLFQKARMSGLDQGGVLMASNSNPNIFTAMVTVKCKI
jgi:opacity protein-like surface antigen